MLIYLGISSLAVFVCALILFVVGEAPLLAVMHLVFSAAILPLIVGAIAHFVPVLTRSREPPRSVLLAPLLIQLAGGLVSLYFWGEAGRAALHAAVGIDLLVTVAFAGWVVSRARNTLGKPHPGWRWYLGALIFLAIGLALVPAMHLRPEWYLPIRLIHLHLNTLGFIGLTAIGTLQVLLPTVLSGPDAEAAARLRRDFPLALVGVLSVALGAAFWWPISLFGAGLLLIVACRLGLSWTVRYGLRKITGDGAAAALLGALCGFVLLLAFGVAHAFGLGNGHSAVLAFIALFLMPLVTGALSQLLPVWRHAGRRTPARDRMRDVLVRGGGIRTIFFMSGGVLLALGLAEGFWLTALGLSHFGYSVVRALLFSGTQTVVE